MEKVRSKLRSRRIRRIHVGSPGRRNFNPTLRKERVPEIVEIIDSMKKKRRG